MLRKVIKQVKNKQSFFNFSNYSFREARDQSKAGWSRTQKRMAYFVLGGLLLKFYQTYYRTDLLFTFEPNKENIDTIKNVPSLRTGKYYPTFYLLNSFMQSFYGSKFDPVPYAPFTREVLQVDNLGGTITLDHLPVSTKYLDSQGQSNQNMRVLIILHGLTGGSECNYVRQAALTAQRKGFRVICVNLRGYSESKLTTPYFTNFTNIEDVSKAINEISSRYPNSSKYCLAYSMGANQLLRYLETDHNTNLKAAVTVSVPWNINELSESMQKPHKFLYNYSITKNFQRNLQWNLDIFAQHQVHHKNQFVDIGIMENFHFQYQESALAASRTNHFDEYITRRMFGYDTVQEMYEIIDCKAALKNIQIPVLLVSCINDPVIEASTIPKDGILQNPNLLLVQTYSGAHIEFFTGYRPTRWINKLAVEYLDYKDKKRSL